MHNKIGHGVLNRTSRGKAKESNGKAFYVGLIEYKRQAKAFLQWYIRALIQHTYNACRKKCGQKFPMNSQFVNVFKIKLEYELFNQPSSACPVIYFVLWSLY